jgi:hypothetical protein
MTVVVAHGSTHNDCDAIKDGRGNTAIKKDFTNHADLLQGKFYTGSIGAGTQKTPRHWESLLLAERIGKDLGWNSGYGIAFR